MQWSYPGYEQDGSIFQVMPEIVALPGDVEQVAAVVKAAKHANVPIVPRGARSFVHAGRRSPRRDPIHGFPMGV